MTLNADAVRERLTFAEKRLDDLLALNSGDLPGADSSYRQQLIQEFFFHIVGATEFLAYLVNEKRALNLESNKVTIYKVIDKLPTSDPIRTMLSSLYVNTGRKPFPNDPYSDDAYIFRILNYRHQVTHRNRNPFLFRKGSNPPTSFILDPRKSTSEREPSKKSAQYEMCYMLKLVRSKCHNIIEELDK